MHQIRKGYDEKRNPFSSGNGFLIQLDVRFLNADLIRDTAARVEQWESRAACSNGKGSRFLGCIEQNMTMIARRDMFFSLFFNGASISLSR